MLGVSLLGFTLVDVVLTTLHPTGSSLLSGRAFRAVWRPWRRIGRLLPGDARLAWLSLAGPLLVPLMLALWTLLVTTAFALIYFAGIQGAPGNVTFEGQAPQGIAPAFRLSWITLSTIGFADVKPSTTGFSLLVAVEALLGLLILTLTITYFLGIQQVVHEIQILGSKLHHQRLRIGDPLGPLRHRCRDGRAVDLGSWLEELHDNLTNIGEGLRRHPITYYFHPRRRGWSLPATLGAIAQTAVALRWGLPASHPVVRDPRLDTLLEATAALVADLQGGLVPVRPRRAARPVPRSVFEAARAQGGARDRWVARFLNLDDDMRGMLVADDEDPADAHERYRAWLGFAVPLTNFLEDMARDLGHGRRVQEPRRSPPGLPLTSLDILEPDLPAFGALGLRAVRSRPGR